ncbi:MAG: hypothetical protein IT372_24220 [Polyangiaceae bacterium]|nr:hypothetical protein [Polyangiaceae bacterium]
MNHRFFVALTFFISACSGTQGSGPGDGFKQGGYTPLPLSNDIFRPGAIIVDRMTQGGQPLAPEVICEAEWSIGKEDPNDKDPPPSPAGDWSSDTEQKFKAGAEAKVLDIVKAKVGGAQDYKVTSTLTNVRVVQLTTARILKRLRDKKRVEDCTCAIELNDKKKKSILQAVILADVVFDIKRSSGTEGELGVDMSQVAASLSANYSKTGSNQIKGSDLTVAYRVNLEDELIQPEGYSCSKPK